MENPYKRHLDKFYQKSNYYSHISFRFENLINKEYQSYITSKSEFYSSNSLIIADWTGETENVLYGNTNLISSFPIIESGNKTSNSL